MKLFQNIIIAVLVLFAFAANAQKVLDLSKFNEIIASGNVNIIIKQGETSEVKVWANVEEDHNINVHVNENILKINLIKSLIRTPDRYVRIEITYEKLYRIKAYAGAEVESEGTITGDKLAIKLNSGAQAELHVTVDDLNIVVSEGSQLELSGTTQSMDVRTSSGGILEAFDLECDYTYVTSNTGGEAEVVAKKRIEAKATTGGRVEYKGKPEDTKISDFLTGTVKRI